MALSSLSTQLATYSISSSYASQQNIDTRKALKLRIIHSPIEATIKTKTCCLCCRDTVGELSQEERVIILVCGFTRECSQKHISPDIIDLCVSYVGNSVQFGWQLLQSLEEVKQKPRKQCIENCQEFWTYCCDGILSCEPFFCDCCCDCWIDAINKSTQKCCSCWKLCEIFIKYQCCWGYFCHFIFIVVIAITVGKDVAALIINHNENCNISGGNINIMFNVYEWVLIGAISNTMLWVIILCHSCCLLLLKKNYCDYGTKISYVFLGFNLILWLFFVPWIIIGFLLYEEMIDDDEISYQCSAAVMSWNLLQLIPTIAVICILVGTCIKKCGDCSEDCSCVSIVVLSLLLLLLFFTAKDIAGLIIISGNNCSVRDWKSKYINLFGVTEWICVGSIVHMVTFLTCVWAGCAWLFDLCEQYTSRICCILFLCGVYLFHFSWMIIGFLFYSEMTFDNHVSKECGDMVLSWSVLQAVENLLGCCVIAWIIWNSIQC